VFSLTLNPET